MPRKEPLVMRLYSEPPLYEVARLVSYGGVTTDDLRDRLKPLAERYGTGAIALALSELTMTDEKTGLTVLRPEARRRCGQLLGPAPEDPDYEDYWQGREKPAHHQPPVPPNHKGMKKRGRDVTVKDQDDAVKGKNRRRLLCMLRDARRQLAHHGRRSLMGKKAKEVIAVAEAELKRRGIDVPPEGQETIEWDRRKPRAG
jgi:hypothetical protein